MLFFLYLLGIPARNRCHWTVISSGTDTRAEHHTIFLKCAQMESLRERSGAVRMQIAFGRVRRKTAPTGPGVFGGLRFS